MNLIDTVYKSVQHSPDAAAFIFRGRLITYREFHGIFSSMAKVFHDQGIRRGDVVAVHMGHAPMHCIALLALARLGAISLPISPGWPVPMRARMAEQFGARVVVSFNQDFGVETVRSIRLDGFALGRQENLDFIDYVPDGATPFRMSLTSGKTGDPKGELLTHGYQLDRIEKTLFDCAADSRVIPFNLNHPIGLTIAFGVLTVGGALIFPDNYEAPDVARAILLYGVTHNFVSPVMASQMLAPLKNDGIAFPTLRHLRIVGGAPREELLAGLRSKVTPHIFVSYGMTELGPVAMATPDILRDMPLCAGKILPWVQLEIVDEAGMMLPPGQLGEIRVKIPGMPTAYHGDDATTRKKFRDGWFYSGDLGRVNEDKLLFIENRIDDVINIGGPKVNLVWLEKILERFPDVAEAVAFALENESGGLYMAAALIPRADNIDMKKLGAYAEQEAGFAAPKSFFIVRDFPRNPSGKLLRAEVTAQAKKMLAESRKT